MGLGSWLNSTFSAERNSDGSIFYKIGQQSHSIDGYSNQKAVLKNPVLFGLVDKIAMYLAQTEFYIGDKGAQTSDPLLDLINDPNEFQSKQDFLKEYIFQRISNGYTFVAPIGPDGFENAIEKVDSLYNLNSDRIDYQKENFQTKLLTREQLQGLNISFRYKNPDGKHTSFRIDQIIPFFDVANGITEDFLLRSPSKIDSVLLPAVNMIKAFEAQNVVIKSNGREMFYSEEKGKNLGIQKPIGKEDKDEIQRKNSQYGMQRGMSRSMFLKGETGWKSLHIDAKDLGLQEAIETTASAIAAAFNVSKDLIPVFSNAKYENQKESEIALIQGVVEPIAADFCNSLSSYFVGYENKPLQYSLDHLAPMQHIEQIKVNKALQLSTAYLNMFRAGFTAEQSTAAFEGLGINLIENE
jgi:phage portal protein BeeE